jgi:DNA-binding HxlR family transcriptional regulator
MDPSRSYRHFCAMARSLELIGERWSLLVVRDLLLGPRRFSDLAHSLGGITPARLTERLRHLQAVGIVERDHRPGRREVWYRLTEAGQDLGPVVDALTLWGIRHARPAVRPGEPVRAEHVLNGTKVWLDSRRIRTRQGATWVWHFPDDEAYTLRYDGTAWQLTREDAEAEANMVVRTTPEAWARFLTTPSSDRRLPDAGVHLRGTPAARAELAAAFDSSLRPG